VLKEVGNEIEKALQKNKSEVLSAADVALYNSKKSGRNKISIVKLAA
jgi:PleD family two-component response regulator